MVRAGPVVRQHGEVALGCHTGEKPDQLHQFPGQHLRLLVSILGAGLFHRQLHLSFSPPVSSVEQNRNKYALCDEPVQQILGICSSYRI
jgi:hypothetical protein